MTVLFICVIFLNFVVAEATSVYNQINLNVNAYILNYRSELIGEADDIWPDRLKT